MGKRTKGFTVCIVGIFFIILASMATAENMFVCALERSKVGPKPADTEAIGSAIFLFDEIKQELTYKVMVEKIEDVYMAHLHMGSDDREGELAAWLYPPKDHKSGERCIEGSFSGTLAEGVIRPEDLKDGITFRELIEALSKGEAYVNVHTKEFLMGALRGQIRTEDYASYMERMAPAAGLTMTFNSPEKPLGFLKFDGQINQIEPLPAGIESLSLHAPYAAGECSLCHVKQDPQAPGPLNKKANEICLECHDDFSEINMRLSTHAPELGICINCHNPHNAKYTNLLINDINTLCFNCHSELKSAGAEAKVKHFVEIKDEACDSCHDPHGA